MLGLICAEFASQMKLKIMMRKILCILQLV